MKFPSLMNEPRLIDEIDDHLDCGRSWAALDDEHKQHLTACVIRLFGEDAGEAILESKDVDILAWKTADYMVTPPLMEEEREIKREIADLLAKIMVNYFSSDLKELFAMRIKKLNWNNEKIPIYLQSRDKPKGENTWKTA